MKRVFTDPLKISFLQIFFDQFWNWRFLQFFGFKVWNRCRYERWLIYFFGGFLNNAFGSLFFLSKWLLAWLWMNGLIRYGQLLSWWHFDGRWRLYHLSSGNEAVKVVTEKLATCSRHFFVVQLLSFIIHKLLVGEVSCLLRPYRLHVFGVGVFFGRQVLIHPKVLLQCFLLLHLLSLNIFNLIKRVLNLHLLHPRRFLSKKRVRPESQAQVHVFLVFLEQHQ